MRSCGTQVHIFQLPIRYASDVNRTKGGVVLASSSVGGAIGAILIFIIVIGLYFLPSIVAVARKVTNQGSVAVINFFLGWTLVGWVVALAMACRTSSLVRESVSSPPEEYRRNG
jgi:hypothetical protein